MTATMKVTNLQNESSATPNIVLNADGTTTIPTQSTTNLSYTGTLTGGTGVINIGSGQVYKDASGNVGIGTGSPASLLHVNSAGASAIATVQSTTYSLFRSKNSSRSVDYGSDGTGGYIDIAAAPFRFFNGASELINLSSSGNLGLGVTPSAWSGVGGVLQLKGNAYIASASQVLELATNGYFDGANWRYVSSSFANRYATVFGEHRFYTAPSGTAGNTISFTQAMTLNASGQLSVGTTSAGATIRAAGSGTTQYTFPLYCTNASSIASFYVRDDGAIITGTSGSGLAACPYNNTTANAANMVVGVNGDLQRSTSSLRYKTDVQNATHGLTDVMNLRFVTYKGKNDGDKIFGGLIAEEVDEAGLTEFVVYDADGQPDALHYGNMVALAFKAIQEQQAIITQLQADVAALKGAA